MSALSPALPQPHTTLHRGTLGQLPCTYPGAAPRRPTSRVSPGCLQGARCRSAYPAPRVLSSPSRVPRSSPTLELPYTYPVPTLYLPWSAPPHCSYRVSPGCPPSPFPSAVPNPPSTPPKKQPPLKGLEKPPRFRRLWAKLPGRRLWAPSEAGRGCAPPCRRPAYPLRSPPKQRPSWVCRAPRRGVAASPHVPTGPAWLSNMLARVLGRQNISRKIHVPSYPVPTL